MFLSGVVAEGAGANVPTLNFWVIGKFSTRQKIFLQKCKIWDEKPHVGEIKRQKEILSTHNRLCRKCAPVCLNSVGGGFGASIVKLQLSTPPTF